MSNICFLNVDLLLVFVNEESLSFGLLTGNLKTSVRNIKKEQKHKTRLKGKQRPEEQKASFNNKLLTEVDRKGCQQKQKKEAEASLWTKEAIKM